VAIVTDGKEVAASVIGIKWCARHPPLSATHGLKTGIAVVIGNDPASHLGVGAKSRMAKECGFNSIQHNIAGRHDPGGPAAWSRHLMPIPLSTAFSCAVPPPRHLIWMPSSSPSCRRKGTDGRTSMPAKPGHRRSGHRPHLLHAGRRHVFVCR